MRQGDALSPLLFALFLNPLLEELGASGFGYKFAKDIALVLAFIAFADDLTLFAGSVKELQKMVSIVERFCQKVGLRLNEEKCEHTYTKASEAGFSKIKINGKEIKAIPPEEATRLLGVYQSMDGKWDNQELRSTGTLDLDLEKIYRKCYTIKQKVRIINLLFIPKIRYRLQVAKFSERRLEELDRRNSKFLIEELRLPPNLKRERMFDEETIGLISIEDEQASSLIATMLEHGFNAPGKFPREALLRRDKDRDENHPNLVSAMKPLLLTWESKYFLAVGKNEN